MVNNQPIVITGMGAITPIGLSVEEMWASLIAGKLGIEKITRFDTSNMPTKVAAQLKGFKPENYMDTDTVARTSWTVQMSIAATKEAIESAGLNMNKEDKNRVGVVGTTMLDQDYYIHGTEVLGEKGRPIEVDPTFIITAGPHSVSREIGMMLGCKGPCPSVNIVCAGGGDAMGNAMNYMRLGYADMMLAVGSDCGLGPVTIFSLDRIGALSKEKDPAKACRPFDLNRSGFVSGEAAGAVVLETLEHARRRGATIYAELAGVGWSFDASSMSAPEPETQAHAMKVAMQMAGISPEDVDYINPHGTGTKLNDSCETEAIKMAFGERAYKIPISASKSMFGHSATADAILESIAIVLSMRDGIIHPTINYETPDPECDLDYVPNVARHLKVNTGMCNNWGLGGENVSVIIRRFKG
ncbi:beta-ketoacyl-[acyl-carrier-protein] synthase family protein [Chloroflexota bacterium]